MILKVKKLHPDVKSVFKKNSSDIGWDVFAHSMKIVGEKLNHPNHPDLWRRIDYIEYSLGFAIQPQPELIDLWGGINKYFTYLAPRSSIRDKNLVMCAGFGTLDAGFKEDIKACFKYQAAPEDYIFVDPLNYPNFGIRINEEKIYKVGERCAQLIVTNQPFVEILEVDSLDETDRVGGHGSSGLL
jgi:hypothetical protein